jgi:hypothetical protein
MWGLYHLGPENMSYLSIDACHMGIEWRPVVGDSDHISPKKKQQHQPQTLPEQPASTSGALYEPVIVRLKDPEAFSRQAIFWAFPELKEYPLSDLFEPHPTRPSTWKYVGRTDDLILFHHGIKYHPAGIEAKIRLGHDQVQEVLMWGDRHQQPVLLVEFKEDKLPNLEGRQVPEATSKRLAALIDQINDEAPNVAQISPNHLIFVTKEKLLPRTPKGNVRRREAAKLYQAEIEEVYARYGDKMAPILTRLR